MYLRCSMHANVWPDNIFLLCHFWGILHRILAGSPTAAHLPNLVVSTRTRNRVIDFHHPKSRMNVKMRWVKAWESWSTMYLHQHHLIRSTNAQILEHLRTTTTQHRIANSMDVGVTNSPGSCWWTPVREGGREG